MKITDEELLIIKQDFDNQKIFLFTIISMIEQIGYSKKTGNGNDLETGFKLGEVFRMLHEFHSDSDRLRNEILLKLSSAEHELNKQKHFIFEQE